jgi:hypothetical protein
MATAQPGTERARTELRLGVTDPHAGTLQLLIMADPMRLTTNPASTSTITTPTTALSSPPRSKAR